MSMAIVRAALLACALSGAAIAGSRGSSQEADACLRVQRLHLDHVQIVSADYHAAGREPSPATTPLGIPWFEVPASCRVKLVITPTSDSRIETQVWMPSKGWNGRLWSLGNGGLGGSIDEVGLLVALSRGYATSSTDTGHQAAVLDGSWALGHPEKLKDYGYRAIHETAVNAKALVRALLGRKPDFSYFAGGSNGGRAALMEAQRYPEDYNGIESGAPALDGSNTLVFGTWLEQSLMRSESSWIPIEKLPAIGAASLAACDELDGLKDGLIDDPRRCAPHPEALACKGPETANCLTAPQIASLNAFYKGPGGEDPEHYPYYGYEPGGETGWGDWSLASDPHKSAMYQVALQFHRYLVYDDATWGLDQFELHNDSVEVDRHMGSFYDARDADLTKFATHGGKLILFHGWADQALQPRLTIDYYQRVQSHSGAEAAANFTALYMVPGMAHVFGGTGPNIFGQVNAPPVSASTSNNIGSALVAWVERAQRPGPITAGKYDNDMKALFSPDQMVAVRTRPLCPYPQVARYKGAGSIDDAANFSCMAP